MKTKFKKRYNLKALAFLVMLAVAATSCKKDFFDLKNGIAGEILQKFSNYRVSLIIVGDFSKYASKSLNDFIYESNKGRHINFVASTTEV